MQDDQKAIINPEMNDLSLQVISLTKEIGILCESFINKTPLDRSLIDVNGIDPRAELPPFEVSDKGRYLEVSYEGKTFKEYNPFNIDPYKAEDFSNEFFYFYSTKFIEERQKQFRIPKFSELFDSVPGTDQYELDLDAFHAICVKNSIFGNTIINYTPNYLHNVLGALVKYEPNFFKEDNIDFTLPQNAFILIIKVLDFCISLLEDIKTSLFYSLVTKDEFREIRKSFILYNHLNPTAENMGFYDFSGLYDGDSAEVFQDTHSDIFFTDIE